MKLDNLRIFLRQLESELTPYNIEAKVYYYFDRKWRTLETGLPVEVHLEPFLESCRNEPIAFHAPSDLTAWFYFEISECAAALRFSNSPQIATRKHYRGVLNKIKEASTNEYKVSHHSLTHLLTKDAFRQSLGKTISELVKTPSTTVTQDTEFPRTLALMALDIDHFKQVNDTWGHLYGDQVLKAFGARLENTATQIVGEKVGSPTVHLGHPSGEEFLISLTANAHRQQFGAWANEFRAAIAEDFLPSNHEWARLAGEEDLRSLTPPQLQERRITTSVGVALVTNVSGVDAAGAPSLLLLDKADTALYRAKAAGRDQVVFFDEILSSCGRILEADEKTGVVALDIGSNVGVLTGQEFKVYPPSFTGKKKFQVSDGRTTRTLGIYPRVESVRIVVFQTQPEISFAFVASTGNEQIQLDVGSHLEAIPAGSIGHLLSGSSRFVGTGPQSPGGSGMPALQDFVKNAVADGGHPFAIVARFTHESEFTRNYGTAALNLALAKLFQAAQVTFHAASCIEVLDHASICIAGSKSAYKESMIKSFVNEQAAEAPALKLLAGVFCDEDYQLSLKRGMALKAENAVDFARFAASEYGREPDNRVRHFSTSTAVNILKALRDDRLYDIAYADFENLRRMGVENPELRNLAGLVASSLGNHKDASEHYAWAMTKDPKITIYKGNYAIASYRAGDVDGPLKVLNALPKEELDMLENDFALAYVVYARLLAKAKLSGSQLFDSARFKQIAPVAIKLPESLESPETKTIEQALASS